MSASTTADRSEPSALATTRAWVEAGTDLLHRALDGTDDARLEQPSLLPGWTRKHVLGHVAANADALLNLAQWASTGVETPMYASPDQRNADIEQAAGARARDLRRWFARSAETLDSALDALDENQWRASVVTAQGRTVPATQIPWLRAREVCVHAVDLDLGLEFDALPESFLCALREDVLVKRGEPLDPTGPLDQVVAYLTGRPHRLTDVPALGPWL